MAGYKFSFSKQPSEELTRGVDFDDDMGPSEIISTATATAINLADDSDASGIILDGSAQIGTWAGVVFTPDASGHVVAQKIKAGEDGKRYKITFKTTTDTSQILEADVVMAVTEL